MGLKALRHIRSVLSQDALNTKARSPIPSKIDYSNSILYEAPLGSVNTLQHVQNSVARIVTKSSYWVSSFFLSLSCVSVILCVWT